MESKKALPSSLFDPNAWDYLTTLALRASVAGGLDLTFDSPIRAPMAVITGTAGNNVLNSGNASDSLSGLAGDDTLNGGAGNDTLNGGTGLDVMNGGTGNDSYYVGELGDSVVEIAAGGIDTVYFVGAGGFYAMPDNVENVIGSGAFGCNLMGNSIANTMTGTASGDLLVGSGGNDTLKGLGGDDLYMVEVLGDVVIEAANGGWDIVYTDLPTYTLQSNVEELNAFNAVGVAATGNALDNYIETQFGNDVLRGGAGNDSLYADTGMDTMIGGTGNDYFEFGSPLGPTNIETITDFNPVADFIHMNSFTFGLPDGPLAATAFKNVGPGGAAVDSSDRILYDQSTGRLYFDADGSGSVGRVQFAVLTNLPTLTFADFLVYPD